MLLVVFFFQAEDGIRDVAVTGVQTCALPIFLIRPSAIIGRLKLGLLVVLGLEQTGKRQYRPPLPLPKLANSQIGGYPVNISRKSVFGVVPVYREINPHKGFLRKVHRFFIIVQKSIQVVRYRALITSY